MFEAKQQNVWNERIININSTLQPKILNKIHVNEDFVVNGILKMN